MYSIAHIMSLTVVLDAKFEVLWPVVPPDSVPVVNRFRLGVDCSAKHLRHDFDVFRNSSAVRVRVPRRVDANVSTRVKPPHTSLHEPEVASQNTVTRGVNDKREVQGQFLGRVLLQDLNRVGDHILHALSETVTNHLQFKVL